MELQLSTMAHGIACFLSIQIITTGPNCPLRLELDTRSQSDTEGRLDSYMYLVCLIGSLALCS